MTTVTMPNGVVGTSTYDNASRLTGISYVKSSVTLASVSYTVDAVGNRTDRTDLAGTESYSYDDYRLTSVTYPGPTTTDYTYDDFGNRTSMTDGAGTTNYAYDDAGRLTTVTPPSPASAISYTSDDNGNVIARGGDSFTWDFENRLTAATVNSTSYTYTYRGDGLRDTATTGGNTTTFTWDVNAALPVVLDDGSQYVYGNGLVSQVAGGNTYYYLTDGLGSVMATTNASGVVVNSYTYDVYGKTTATSGAQANDRQFAGQQTDPTGLQYLRARYYDPSTGSFLSRDPLSAGPAWAGNPFGYAGGNPAAVIDPSGWSGLPCSAGPSGDDGDKPGSQCAGSSLGGGGGNSFGGIPGGGDEGGAFGGSGGGGDEGPISEGDDAGPIGGDAVEAGPLIGEYPNVANVTANRASGLDAEAAVSEFLQANGVDVVGEHVTVNTPFGPRVLDLVVEDASGDLHGIEVKSGNAQLSLSQMVKDAYINSYGQATAASPSKPAVNGRQIVSVATIIWR